MPVPFRLRATQPARLRGTTSARLRGSSSGAVPTIASVTNNATGQPSGVPAGGDAITVIGANFTGMTAVKMGGSAGTDCTSRVVVNDSTITCVTPAKAAGTYDLCVINATGASTASAADQFTYTSASTGPTITSLTPTGGSTTGGTTVQIAGTGFTGATSVTFGGTTATYVVNSATSITATSPVHTAGAVNVLVTTPVGNSGTSLASAFTYTTPPPPGGGLILDVRNAVPQSDVFPTLIVEVAFATDPLDNAPIWTDISSRCRQVTITRGRSFELDDVVAGTATFTFNNLDRALDPVYADGPYYGKLTARRRIRFSASYAGTTYIRFDGFVNSWPQTANDPSQHFAETVVTATDMFAILAANKLRTVAPMITNDPVFGIVGGPYKTGGQLRFKTIDTCQARINRILDLWPIPVSMRAIDAGSTPLAVDTPDAGETSLNYLRRINASEDGRLFVSRDGKLTFQSNDHWITDQRQLQSQITLTDHSPPSYAGLQIDPSDDRYIRNRIVRGRLDMAAPIVAQDLRSILTHGELEDSKTDCLSAFVGDMQAQVKWLLAKYSDPPPERFSLVRLLPQRFPSVLFPFVLNAELGDRITLSHTLVKTGDPLIADVWIEEIKETITPASYQVEYSVAPVSTTNPSGAPV